METSVSAVVIKILSLLGLLVAICAIAVRLRHPRGRLRSRGRLKVADSLSLGGNRWLCLIDSGRSLLLLGVTDHSITLIKELAQDSTADETDCSPWDDQGQSARGSGKEFLLCLKEELKKAKACLFRHSNFLAALCIVFLLAAPGTRLACAAPAPLPVPEINVTLDGAEGGGPLATALGILGLLTVLTLAPAILILTTSFTRIVVVFSFLRSGLGTQQTPPNQVIVGLALLLTFFVMMPTWSDVNEIALSPYLAGEITGAEAFEMASDPLKEFMLRQTREKDLALFVDSEAEEPESPRDLGIHQVVPAFVLSELKTAFQIGFMLFLPFLVVDMVVASTLMAMGMMMLPPVLISLPFKILLFVLVDGWTLVTGSLVAGFR